MPLSEKERDESDELVQKWIKYWLENKIISKNCEAHVRLAFNKAYELGFEHGSIVGEKSTKQRIQVALGLFDDKLED